MNKHKLTILYKRLYTEAENIVLLVLINGVLIMPKTTNINYVLDILYFSIQMNEIASIHLFTFQVKNLTSSWKFYSFPLNLDLCHCIFILLISTVKIQTEKNIKLRYFVTIYLQNTRNEIWITAHSLRNIRHIYINRKTCITK